MLKKLEQRWIEKHGDNDENFEMLMQLLKLGCEVIEHEGKLILIFEKDVDDLYEEPPAPIKRRPKGQEAYERRKKGEKWIQIESDIKHAVMLAKGYAMNHKLEWPIKMAQ